MPDIIDPKESKEYKELIEQFNRYIEYGKQKKLIPESVNTMEEFLKLKDFPIIMHKHFIDNYRNENH